MRRARIHRRGRSGRVATLSAGVLSLATAPLLASPTGGQVTAGNGQITQNGNQTTIAQQSQNLAIDWQSFNIGANQGVTFKQPGTTSIVLNEVVGQSATQILGSLKANGQVFILNPNGVLFGSGAQVSVGGLVAGTLGLNVSDFVAGKYDFFGNSSAAVSNAGSITAANGGYIALLGARVSNSGSLIAPLGNVSLAAGQQVTLQLANGSLLGLTVNQGAVDALVSNEGLIRANGGQVLLTAAAADALTKAVVNNSGIIEAQSLDTRNGTIQLLGDMNSGTVDVSGTLDASNTSGGTSGQIDVFGSQVNLLGSAQLSANGVTGGGTIHVGGDFHGSVASENATSTYVADGVSINANATEYGNGGQVSVWSNEQTYMYGDITAMGGASGGNGGFVETSGKNYLDFRGKVDLLASHGTTGTLLLDPNNITIDDGSGTPAITGVPGTGDEIYSSPTTSYVSSATINSELATTNVLVQTGAASGGSSAGGSIIVANTASLNWTTSNTLALSASQDIQINSAISGPSGTLELVAANGSITQTTTTNTTPITVNSLAASAPSGSVSLTNAYNVISSVAGTSSSGGFTLSTANPGTLVVTSVPGIVNAQTTGISSPGGTVTLDNTAGSIATSGATISGSTLAVNAAANIGSTTIPLATAVQTLNATGNSNSTVAISNTSGTLALTAQDNNINGGDFYIKTSGALNVTGVQNPNGDNIVLDAGTAIAINGPVTSSLTVDLEAANGNISQGAGATDGITAPDLLINAPHGTVTFAHTSYNDVVVLAGKSAGAFKFYDSGPLFLDTVTTPATGAFTGTTDTGIQVTGPGNITLGTAQYFQNEIGPTALTVANGYWLVYSTNPAQDLDRGLSENFLQYNATIGATANSQASGNGFLYSIVPTLTVGLTGTIEKTYDGLTAASPTQGNYSIANGINGDSITIGDATANYASKNVSTVANPQSVTVTGLSAIATHGGVPVFGYQIGNTGDSVAAVVGVIDPASLVVGAESVTKVFDGTTNATVTNNALLGTGLQNGDQVTGTESFGSKNVLGHNGSTLSVTGYTIKDGVGNDVTEDYTATTQMAAGTITPATVTLVAGTYTKVYDATTAAAGTVSWTGLFGSDTLTGATEKFVSSNVLGANGSTLTITNGSYTVNDGNNGSNYTVVTQTSRGTITPAPLTLTTVTDTKTYDGTTSAPGTMVGVSGLLGSDSISGDVEAFTSKNVAGTNGSTLTVASGYVISDGNNGHNYAVTANTSAGTITPAALTLAAVTDTKTYDATTNATGITLNVAGLQGSDTVTGLTESFGSKNVMGANGSTLSVNSGYTVNDSNGGNNYTISTSTAMGTITPAALSLSAATDSKTYDGTTSATGTTVVISGLQGSDTLTGLTESFASKNVMGTNGGTLSVNSGYTLNDGNGGNNYTVTADSATGTISRAPLTITANSASKPAYTPNPPFTATYVGLATGDSPSSLGGTLQFGTTATTKSPLGNYAIVPSGASSGNYTIDFVDGILTIIPGAVTTAIEPGGVYDAAVTPADGLLSGSTPPSAQPAGPWLTVKRAGIALPPGVIEVE
jgi:filamentous hemagglutinin family protein